MDDTLKKVYDRLLEIRTQDNLSLKPCKHLNPTFIHFDGSEREVSLRYYQVQGVFHMLAMKRFVLGDDTGLGKCVVGDTLIATNRGLVAIQDIYDTSDLEPDTFHPVEGWEVIVNGESLPITRFYYGGVKPTIKVTTQSGYNVEGSLVHPILVRKPSGQEAWVTTSDLEVGDVLCIERKEALFPTDEPLISEGSPPIYMNPFIAILWGGLIGVQENLRIPPLVLRSTRESQKEFLRGLADVIASVGDEGLFLSCTRGANQLRVMLLQFGVITRSVDAKTLLISGLDAHIYQEKIGWLDPGKSSDLQSYCDSIQLCDFTHIPHIRKELEDLYSHPLSKGFSASPGDNTYHGLRQVLDVVQRLGLGDTPSYRILHDIEQRHFFYDPVVTLEKGEAEVMDIEVDHPSHSFVGNGLVNHNTIQVIATLCYLWEKTPNLKAIVLTTKSSVEQWKGEFEKFTNGITVMVCKGTPKKRERIREEFLASEGPTVMVMGYRSVVNDFTALQHWSNFILVCDEVTAVKNPQTQIHKRLYHIAENAERCWGLSATIIKNNLLEGWGIYRVVVPGLFGSKSNFMSHFTVTKLQSIPGRRGKIPVIVGYSKRHIDSFKERIDPYFLGRAKFEVASELPVLTTREIKMGMTPTQHTKYADALAGLLELTVDNEAVEKEVSPLTAIIYCQQIVNHLALLGFEGESSEKVETLWDLLTEDEFAEENVIVFTRFRKLVDHLMPLAAKKGIKATRITGAETEDQRRENMAAFQNADSDTRVVFITMAASEAINLQSAKAIIFIDSPWSAGDYIQILGRMIRIGSLHDRVYALHLIVKNSIDEHVMKVLRKKLDLINRVLGQRIKGESEADFVVEESNDILSLFGDLKEDAKQKRI